MALPLSCPAQETNETIRFAVFPYKSPKSVIEVFSPLAARIEKRLGKKVLLVSATDSEAFLKKSLAGEYDLALPSITVYYKMLPAGYTAIAKGIPSFWGGVIVRQDSEIKTIEQCKGKKIAAIGEHSYAGYMFFKAQLDEKRIDSKKDLDLQFVGKLDTIIYGVLNKKYDGGVIRLDTLEMKDFAPVKDQFRIVSRSAEVPQFPFVVKSGMDQRTASVIREVLTSLSPDKPEDLAILKSLQIKKIVAATKEDYDPFYKVIKNHAFYTHH
ncbi:phosphate/phosphite/phosphonate ABC transporter substrate-binding protein [Thiovibrio frasassiensis]|uniref:Phosphate/phosphite/phosphonate ABC transporter substrate-binding protein n=1 Tax=Thiovibrio frasassiensis TaxID=2984131 RepID=A0A9X4MFX2_9BACT|nr:phosphate/phosphite/phosphonate ABC transporter substrate-binding protein [Thiovibrio frasassiensis]MDG4476759.1 phosphate/phosphite/phosphonate ABC transporter substrate-binding protein [Thiovibrio frasassiensis]